MQPSRIQLYRWRGHVGLCTTMDLRGRPSRFYARLYTAINIVSACDDALGINNGAAQWGGQRNSTKK